MNLYYIQVSVQTPPYTTRDDADTTLSVAYAGSVS